jgi:hypothetical protein
MTLNLPMAGLILERSALATGFLAAAIAVGGFLSRAQALMTGADEENLRWQATVGGLYGFLFGLMLILLDAVNG